MQCKHLLLRTFDFPKVVFYIFMSPINNAPLSNELQPVLIDLKHFKKVFESFFLCAKWNSNRVCNGVYGPLLAYLRASSYKVSA
jgi:hypothetical protein